MRQLLWVWMLLMALAFVNDRCHCCLQEERSGLLEIKAWFMSHAAAESFWLQGWDKEHFNCCNWDWISCDSTTSRVIKLDLSYINSQRIPGNSGELEDLYLNASLFLPFKELEFLDLRSNQLAGGLKNQGFQALASVLRKLKELRLSNNKFNDSVLSSLSGFSTLESLDLSGNCFTGTVGLGGFQALASGLRKLKILDLSDNKFNDSILSSLRGFSTLKSLYLSGNCFSGTVGLGAFQGLASGLRKLEELTLSNNKFNDSILLSLSGFSTLKSLDLSNNSFTGTIGLRGLRKLEVLYLESSDFKENILLESLGGLPSLKTLYASETEFEGKHFGKGLCNSTSLEEMSLQGSSLPASFLGNIGTTLKVLYLTGVDFHGTSPAQAPQNLTKLEELFLDDASPITTSFLSIIGPLPALRTLYLQGCMLSGTLPHQGWCELKNLEELYLSQNNLKGVLPPCLGNLSSLRYLDLSYNQFEGNIAFSHLSHLSQLEYLSISNNYFQVPISFGSFMNLSSLKDIECDNNELVPASPFQPSVPKLQLSSFSASSCTSKLLNAGFPSFLHSQYDLEFVDLSHNMMGQ